MAERDARKRSVAAKPPPVEPARHYGPRGIAGLLAPVLRPALRRRGSTLAALIEDWPAIAGPEVAMRSLPVKFAAGTLTIGCAGPDALTFQHLAPTLIGRINLALGGQPVARLRFTDLAIPAPPAQIRPAARPAPDLTDLPDGPIGAALARLRQNLGERR